MNNKYHLLWAQWGILNYEQFLFVKREFGDLGNAWGQINVPFLLKLGFGPEKASRLMELKTRLNLEQLVSVVNKNDVSILFVEDGDYPSCLRSIPNPPVFLFVRGDLPPLHKSLGVVGTRMITSYGTLVAEKLVSDLVRNGFVVTSGLALGVDALSHRMSLRLSGKTIAVLGSGVDVIYPRSHCYLAQQILDGGGAIVSEYPLGSPALKHHFPLRNRIISGLSRGVLIVEGGVRSGALITARYALEQGREVFAVPSGITHVGLSGANNLIRRGEAKLVESVNHILEEFQMQPNEVKQHLTFSSIESELLERILNGGKTIDALTLETTYNVAKLAEVFMGLQLKGVVREINRRWVII